jgi:RluA family pseudouridine synthase
MPDERTPQPAPRRPRVSRPSATQPSGGKGEKARRRAAAAERGNEGRGAAPSQALTILYEDAVVVIVAKPAGLLSVANPQSPSKSVPELLAAGGLRALPVHRLDREVSGALILAKHEAARAELEAAFRAHEIGKTYWALIVGYPRAESGVHRFPLIKEGSRARVSSTGQPCETRWRVLRRLGPCTELEIELITGRYNQIRAHFAHAGTPLVGERKYAQGKDDPLRANRLALHAWKLRWRPAHGAGVAVEASLPAALENLKRAAARLQR